MKPYGHERQSFPYWKVQVYRPDQLAWFDIQKQYTVQKDAEEEAKQITGKRVRLMEVTPTGRRALTDTTQNAG